MQQKDIEASFHWGVSAAAFQTEGATDQDGKGPSIWDDFTARKGNIYKNQHARTACDFYHRYPEDIAILKQLGIPNFRFSVAWSRVLPEGIGRVNQPGLDFYKRLTDYCLEMGITPWLTLYHWDLPLALSQKGGWTNRQIVDWFAEFADLISRQLGDRVKHWMVLNEPLVFTGGGYFLGIHAPGKRGMKNFLPAVHHAALCQAEGGRLLRQNCPDGNIGTTFSCSHIEPYNNHSRHRKAADRVDALLNRLFIEPSLGMGYPVDSLPALKKIEKYHQAGDEEKLLFDFDFIGLQNYTREIIQHSWLMPYLHAKPLGAEKRSVPTTLMNWEVYPEGIYHILKKFHTQYRPERILITENGAAFTDELVNGQIADDKRVDFLKTYIGQCLRAREEGVPLEGYFVWTLTDNFEWAEGYRPTFGLVHIDLKSQKRTIKKSARWYAEFISQQHNI